VRSTGLRARLALDIGCPPAIHQQERPGGDHAPVAAAGRSRWILSLTLMTATIAAG